MNQKFKSRSEIQHQKQLEREEFEKLTEYNPFGRSGGGAPIKDQNGNLILTRKTIADGNIYQENGNFYNQTNINPKISNSNPLIVNQQSQNTMNQNNYDQLSIPNLEMKQNYQYSHNPNPFPLNQQIPPNYYHNNNPIRYQSENYEQQKNGNFPILNLQNQQLFNRDYNALYNHPQPQIDYQPLQYQNQFQSKNGNIFEKNSQLNQNTNKLQKLELHDNGNQPPAKSIGQINEESKSMKILQYQSSLLAQIEENKKRKELEKQKKWELEKIEDEKIRQHHEKFSEIQKKEQEKRLRFLRNDENENEKEQVLRNESPQKLKLNHDYISPEPSNPYELSNLNKYSHNDNNFMNNQDKNLIEFTSRIKRNFENINYNITNSINDQIMNLKKDISKNHRELADSILKIHNDTKEVSFIKMNSEREYAKIKEQIEKKKINNDFYERKLNDVFEKYNPYKATQFHNLNFDANNGYISKQKENFMSPNSSYTNFNKKEQNIPYLKSNDLISTSKMIYSNDDLINEKIDFEEKKETSKMANYGKSLMGDSKFIPINETKRPDSQNRNIQNHTSHQNPMINDSLNENESFYSFKRKEMKDNLSTPIFNDKSNLRIKGISDFKAGNSEGLSTLELNSQIDDLARINYLNDPSSKYDALRKKVEHDMANIEKNNIMVEYYDHKKFDKENKVDMKKLDSLLESLMVDEKKTNQKKESKVNTHNEVHNNEIAVDEKKSVPSNKGSQSGKNSVMSSPSKELNEDSRTSHKDNSSHKSQHRSESREEKHRERKNKSEKKDKSDKKDKNEKKDKSDKKDKNQKKDDTGRNKSDGKEKNKSEKNNKESSKKQESPEKDKIKDSNNNGEHKIAINQKESKLENSKKDSNFNSKSNSPRKDELTKKSDESQNINDKKESKNNPKNDEKK